MGGWAQTQKGTVVRGHRTHSCRKRRRRLAADGRPQPTDHVLAGRLSFSSSSGLISECNWAFWRLQALGLGTPCPGAPDVLEGHSFAAGDARMPPQSGLRRPLRTAFASARPPTPAPAPEEPPTVTQGQRRAVKEHWGLRAGGGSLTQRPLTGTTCSPSGSLPRRGRRPRSREIRRSPGPRGLCAAAADPLSGFSAALGCSARPLPPSPGPRSASAGRARAEVCRAELTEVSLEVSTREEARRDHTCLSGEDGKERVAANGSAGARGVRSVFGTWPSWPRVSGPEMTHVGRG